MACLEGLPLWAGAPQAGTVRAGLYRRDTHPPTSSMLEVKGVPAECQRYGGERAVEGDLREHPGRRDLVAREIDAVAPVDGRPVAPVRAGQVDGSRTAVRDGLAPPGDAFAPAVEGEIEQLLRARDPVRPGLVRGDRDLPLEELFAGGCQGAVLGGEPFDPAGGVEVGDGEGVTPPGAQGEVEKCRTAARPGPRVVAEEPAGRGEGGGDDDRGVGGQGVDAGESL